MESPYYEMTHDIKEENQISLAAYNSGYIKGYHDALVKNESQKHETCKMVEDATEIHCSECGCRMSDEIYFMFKGSEEDFKFCPCCGRRIEK